MKKKSKVLEESEDLELEAAGELEEGQEEAGAEAGEDNSLLGQMKKIQEQLFYLERKVDQILERNSGGGGRRDFGGGGGFNRNRGGGDRGPRRDFRGGGDRGPRRDFRGGGGGDRPRRDFGGPRREFGGGGENRGNRDFGGGENRGGGDRDFSGPKRTFGGGDSSPRQWNRKD